MNRYSLFLVIALLSHIFVSAQTVSGSHNGYDYVDLGLPSGTLWATCNVGANRPEEYGDYYAWGEIITKNSYSYSLTNSKWDGVEYDQLKRDCVIDVKGNMTETYDVASVKWNGEWRIPTQNDIKELCTCESKFVTRNGIKGREFTGKNGNKLFFPFAGYHFEGGFNYIGRGGYYLSATALDDRRYSSLMYLDSDDAGGNYRFYRYYGQSVRPVLSGKPNNIQTTTTVVSNNKPQTPTVNNNKPTTSTPSPHKIAILGFRASTTAISAGVPANLILTVKNTGTTTIKNCKAKIETSGNDAGLAFSDKTIPPLAPKAVKRLEIPVSCSGDVESGFVTFTVTLTANGKEIGRKEVTVQTVGNEVEEEEEYKPTPSVYVTNYSVTCPQGTTIVRRQSFDLQLIVENQGYGDAENVSVGLSLPNGVTNMGADRDEFLGGMKSEDRKSIVYSIAVGNNAPDVLPIKVNLREKEGKYGNNFTMNLKVGQRADKVSAEQKVRIEQINQMTEEMFFGDPSIDNETNIPLTNTVNSNTYVLIIANQEYKDGNVMDLKCTKNDARVFYKYCTRTLGIPKENIRHREDLTSIQMKVEIERIKDYAKLKGKDAKIIFYYSGHGGSENGNGYLVPIDCDLYRPAMGGIKLSELYRDFGALDVESVTVFLDACHSGAKSGTNAKAMPMAKPVDNGTPQGRTVVFSACKADEASYEYEGIGHGKFTYYVLKKLKESKGNCTLGELRNYIDMNFSEFGMQAMFSSSNKKQTPTVQASPKVREEWKEWRMK